jgi:hypothetical protein
LSPPGRLPTFLRENPVVKRHLKSLKRLVVPTLVWALVNKLIEDMKLYQKSWLDHVERMDRSRFSVTTPGMTGCWKTKEKLKSPRTH